MAALYSHTDRSTGTVLTAVIYNADHQNHIDNGIPAQLDDYSTNATTMQSTTDPGAVSSESLATSLAGELERLRYFLKSVHGGAQWYSLAPSPHICDFRLSLTTAVPVTTADVTAAETVYWVPYCGNRVSLYDGTSRWYVYSVAELSIDVPDATNCYDVFVYNNAGTPTLELTAWTNATTRATALTLQNGVLVKTGATTRRYLGTFYSTTAGNGQVEDSMAKRNLWNYYNRVARPMQVREGTNTWAYTVAAFQQANASTANQLEFTIGVSEDLVRASVLANSSNDNASIARVSAIGLDSTSAKATNSISGQATAPATITTQTTAEYSGFPAVGNHYLAWLELSTATGITTWYGDAGASIIQSGIFGELMG